MQDSLKIVAIGGGNMRELGTLDIDKRVIELTGKTSPNALFIPTASGDHKEYIEFFEEIYGQKLGCKTKTLTLLHNRPNDAERSALIRNADLIYVGGGNTYRMMKLWRRLGVDKRLNEAASHGTVLSGISAGAICWFRFGHSDSRSFTGNPNWDYIRVSGLGLVHALYCPHYHGEAREASLSKMMAKYGGLAVACDNHAAIEIVGGEYRVITSLEGAQAYRIFKKRGEIIRETLNQSTQHQPLAALLTKR